MQKLHDPIRLSIAQNIFNALKLINKEDLGEIASLEQIYHDLVPPPQSEMGDLAYGCFRLAKALRKGPPQIAAELVARIDAKSWATSAQAAGPYINFHLLPEFIGKNLFSKIKEQSFFKTTLLNPVEKTMIEFSQPNTHKELHVGHMRNACLGDALVKVLRYAGVPVISSTFPGDVGTHVAKCLWYLKYHNTEPIPQEGRGEWLGQMYSKANLKLEDEEKTPQNENNKKRLTEILQQLEAKKGEFYDLWKETRQWSVDLMKNVYQWMGIEFDQWYWESEVDSPSVKYVKELFAQGLLIQSEGAIGMDLAAENLGFCMLLKSDGTGLYATKDIELARRKFKDFGIEKSIYVVDVRQALHFKQVFKVLEKLGYEQAKKCFHLQYNFVELPDGAMSSRKGNIVPLIRLVHKMEAMVKEKYLSRYKSEWSEDEIDLVATQVAQGAIKYGMVKIDNNKKIVFDMDEWLKIDGDSGPFIQYSAARIQSLCRKLNYDGAKSGIQQWNLLQHKAEKELLQGILHFHTVVAQAAETYRPSVICTYLYDLAKRFNLFYHECSMANAESEALKLARLDLSYCTGEVLKKGLGLIGIPTPQRM